MRLGLGFTAVAQQAPWLAGLVRIPCLLKTKDRHSATGITARKKGQCGFEPTLAFLLKKYSSHVKVSQLALIGHI